MSFNPDQPRDDHGRWGDGGSGAAREATAKARSSGAQKDHAAAAKAHEAAADAHSKKFKDTEEKHRRDGKWDPERVAIHEKYAAKVMDGVPRSSAPTVHMTGGGPASGKTTGLLENPKTGIPDKSHAAHIDPDGAKTHIPEYNSMVKAGDKGAAAYVHEESSHMAKVAVADALGNGHDVVYDSVGDSGIDKLSKKVEDMRASGAQRVVAHYATVDVDEAIRRSDARAERTGRFVPHEYIRQAHGDVSRTAQAAIKRGTFDKLDVWDTTARTPVHVASFDKSGSGLTIHDQAAWKQFQRRGEQ